MRRQNRNSFEPQSRPRAAPLGLNTGPPRRVPQQFIEAMKRVSGTPEVAPKTQPKKPAEEISVDKWKPAFQPIDNQDEKPEEKNTNDAARVSIYDPSSPLSSDSDEEASAEHQQPPPPLQDSSLRSQRLSADRDSRRWEGSFPERANRPGYEFPSGHLEPRVHSPDRLIHGASTQCVPESSRGPRTEARGPLLEYSREMTSTLRASPPRLKRDHQPLGYVERGPDLESQTPPKMMRSKAEKAALDKCPITCDLCDLKLSNAQELEDHLDSKGHWDTLEFIQQRSNYDDMVVAFLQEVMVYKSQHCSRAVEGSALPALQENHHMTKVEMLHCAACKVHVSTSAAEVQEHISSLEHVSNAKEFKVQQRRSSLSKAEAMLKKLQPQFELFLKGACPFE